MHDRLFADQKGGLDGIPRHAEAIALDRASFQQCLDSRKPAADIRASIGDAGRVGISGPPTFMLGLTAPKNGKVKIVQVLRGAQPYTALKTAIDALLAK